MFFFLSQCNNGEIWKERNNKRKVLCCKNTINNWDVNVYNIVISRLIETKTNYKYLFGIKFDKAMRLLVLKMPKMSGYVKTFKI